MFSWWEWYDQVCAWLYTLCPLSGGGATYHTPVLLLALCYAQTCNLPPYVSVHSNMFNGANRIQLKPKQRVRSFDMIQVNTKQRVNRTQVKAKRLVFYAQTCNLGIVCFNGHSTEKHIPVKKSQLTYIIDVIKRFESLIVECCWILAHLMIPMDIFSLNFATTS